MLILLFLLIEYKYRVETTKYELDERLKKYLVCYDYSDKEENSEIKEEQSLGQPQILLSGRKSSV